MPITFTCPNPACQSTMTVADSFAGKQGKCSKCKGPVTVPAARSNGVPTPAPAIKKPAPPPPPAAAKAPAPAPVDYEAEALAALSDEPREEAKVADFIEFNCPQCDEPLKLPLDLAGKRDPCPECRRIITVPYPQKKEKANWRDTGPKLPTGAKRDDGPAPDGSWGTAGRTGVSREALEEAGVIKEKEKPLTFEQKARPYLFVGVPLLLLGGGVLIYWWVAARNLEKNSLNYALNAPGEPASAKALGMDGQVAIHGYAGVYFLRHNKPEARDSAREQFGKAVNLAAKTRSAASDALLGEFAVAQLALGGGADDTPADFKRHWSETQKLLAATLREIDSQDGRLVALRRLCAGLIDAGQGERVLPLVNALPLNDVADRCEALATVGMELDRLGKKDEAMRALTDSLAPYGEKKKERPPLRAAVVALALVLGKPAPAPAEKNQAEAEQKALGEADALARQGKLSEARAVDKGLFTVADGGRLRFLITVAIAAAESKNGNDDLQTALAAVKDVQPPRADLARALVRLIETGVQAGLSPEALEPAVAGLADPGLEPWGRLLLLRAKLSASRSVEPAELVDAIPANTLGGLVARLELARHNTRLDSGWASKVKAWDEGPRALGSLGVALGMQKAK